MEKENWRQTMIPLNFDYYKPKTLYETIDLFHKLHSIGKKPMYYAGGTEIISMARLNNIQIGAVIDIKGIPECNIHELKNNKLIIGSAITLTDIANLNYYPLLSLTVKRIADHTIQGKITLGGNLAGTIIYREAVLPLLVADSHLMIASKKEIKTLPIKDIFQGRIQLEKGELILQVIIDEKFLSLSYAHIKRTKNEKIDYPLITISALKNRKNKINIGFSGICEYPFRSYEIEKALNSTFDSMDERVNNAINNLPDKLLNDLAGSSEYRKFMLKNMLYDILKKFEVAN